jgi:DNA-binding XRE family transcriptional regulator
MTTKKKKLRYGLEEFERDFGRLSFADVINSERLCAEMSQKDFAKLLGISQASLCDLEKGRKIPSPKRAAKIARILQKSDIVFVSIAIEDSLIEAGIDYKVILAPKKIA